MYHFPYHIVNGTKYCTVFPNFLHLGCIDLHKVTTVENYLKRALLGLHDFSKTTFFEILVIAHWLKILLSV